MEYITEFTAEQIDKTIERAEKVYGKTSGSPSYMVRKLNVLKDLKNQMVSNKDRDLSSAQANYLCSLMNTFSDEELTKAENWSEEWQSNQELRERADVISKYYIAQSGWFMDVARNVQRTLTEDSGSMPDFHMFHRMILNEYAEKVWESHKAEHKWKAGELVCCRANAKIDGWTYQIRADGVNVNKDPCMVLESGSKPISNASKYDEKRGGCRWVSINPIGTTHIFHVMEKDLKIYRQPKKKPTKRSKK